MLSLEYSFIFIYNVDRFLISIINFSLSNIFSMTIIMYQNDIKPIKPMSQFNDE